MNFEGWTWENGDRFLIKDDYAIPLHKFRTLAHLAFWVEHMAHKPWIKKKDIVVLVQLYMHLEKSNVQ